MGTYNKDQRGGRTVSGCPLTLHRRLAAHPLFLHASRARGRPYPPLSHYCPPWGDARAVDTKNKHQPPCGTSPPNAPLTAGRPPWPGARHRTHTPQPTRPAGAPPAPTARAGGLPALRRQRQRQRRPRRWRRRGWRRGGPAASSPPPWRRVPSIPTPASGRPHRDTQRPQQQRRCRPPRRQRRPQRRHGRRGGGARRGVAAGGGVPRGSSRPPSGRRPCPRSAACAARGQRQGAAQLPGDSASRGGAAGAHAGRAGRGRAPPPRLRRGLDLDGSSIATVKKSGVDV